LVAVDDRNARRTVGATAPQRGSTSDLETNV
jgi:hypothetical protein